MADPTEINKPVAMADVAESSGPAVIGAGGPVVTGAGFRRVTKVAGASGPAGTQFLVVAEVYAPLEETEDDLQGDIGRVDQISKIRFPPVRAFGCDRRDRHQ